MQELGEETFPEPTESVESVAAASPVPSTDAATSAVGELAEEITTTATPEHSQETLSPQTSSSSSPSPAASTPTSADSPQIVTTQQRKPLPIPSSVHVRITPETLKDYVGPPVYQKDRMYARSPPPGVSTGLGYLGNGSGAVMPVEAMVRICVSF